MWLIILFPGVLTVAILDSIMPYNFDFGQKIMFSIVFCIVYYLISAMLAFKLYEDDAEVGCFMGAVVYIVISVVIMFILALLYFGFKVEIIGELLEYL